MTPLTVEIPQRITQLLAANTGLAAWVENLQIETGLALALVPVSQIIVSAASADLLDKVEQVGYPRVAVYTAKVENTLLEKFRSLSGTATAAIAISVSSDLIEQVERNMHFYIEAVTGILRQNTGDWGDGLFFSGKFDVQLQPPKAGGIGFVQTAIVGCTINVSRN
jgi:hypothetical protein